MTQSPQPGEILTSESERLAAPPVERTEGLGSFSPEEAKIPTVQADQSVVDHMVQRFLWWRLPEDFNPDDGISFTPTFNAPGGPQKRNPGGPDHG